MKESKSDEAMEVTTTNNTNIQSRTPFILINTDQKCICEKL